MTPVLLALAALLTPAGTRAAGAALDFNSALDTIVRRSTAVAIQQQTLEETRAKNLPVRTGFLPTLSADVTETRYRYGGQNDPSYIASGTHTYQLQGALNVFRFGADLSAWHAATDDENAQEAQLDAAILRAEDAGVQLLVTDMQRAREAEVQRRMLDSRETLSKIGRERYERGLLPLQEWQKLEIDRANAASRLKDATILYDAARAALVVALGEGPNVAREWPWQDRFDGARTLAKAPLRLESLPAWQAAHAQVAAEEERETRNLRLLLPSVDLTGNYGYTNTFDNNGPLQLGWTGTLAVTVPLFDHLTNYSSYRAQVAVRRTAEQTLEQVERDARSELLSAVSAFVNAYDSAKSRSRTAETAQKLYSDNLRRLQAGRISADDLAIDQQRLSDAELLDVDGWAAAHLAYSRVCHALGRKIAECGGQPASRAD